MGVWEHYAPHSATYGGYSSSLASATMASSSSSSISSAYFLSLSILAGFLLWGISLANGTITAMIHAAWTGSFEDGTTFHTTYTGIFAIDFPVSLLVAFFFYGTNGSHLGYQLFLIDAYATLQTAFVWLYAEESRPGPKPWLVAHPVACGLLWQCFGAAIALPLYFRQHLEWNQRTQSDMGPIRPAAAIATSVSFLLGAILPAIAGLLPLWYPRTDSLHQTILAVWQLDPIYVSAIQALVTWVAASRMQSIGPGETSRRVSFAYLFAAIVSAIGHISAVTLLVLSDDPRATITSAYLPFPCAGPIGANLQLASGSWLFLQFDLIIISLSCLSWAYLLTASLLPKGDRRRATIPLIFAFGWMLLGTGATVSLALLWREKQLQVKCVGEKAKR